MISHPCPWGGDALQQPLKFAAHLSLGFAESSGPRWLLHRQLEKVAGANILQQSVMSFALEIAAFAMTVEAENGRALKWDFVCTYVHQAVPLCSNVFFRQLCMSFGFSGLQTWACWEPKMGTFHASGSLGFSLWDLRSLTTLFDRKECKTSSPLRPFCIFAFLQCFRNRSE